MKIWYFHPYGGGPGVGRYFRPYELGRRWASAGHEVEVFVASNHHLLDQGSLTWRRQELEGMVYRALPTNSYKGNGLGRILNMARYAFGMVKLAREPRPDVIIYSSPHPLGVYAGWLLSRMFGIPFVYEIRDLWPLSLIELLGVSRFHPFVLLCDHAERLAARSAVVVAGLLPGVGDYFRDCGEPLKRFEWLPNGANLDQPTHTPPTSENGLRTAQILDAWRAEGRVIMITAGSLGPPNGIEPMLEALDLAARRLPSDRLGAVILGDGILAADLKNKAQALGLSHVLFSGSVAKSEALYLIDRSDFGYAGVQNIPNLYRYGTSPNKIMDYLQAAKPAIFPIALKDEPVYESGAGFAFDADGPELIANAIVSMVEMSNADREQLGRLGVNHLRKYFDWDLVAARYAEVLAQVVGAARRPPCPDSQHGVGAAS